SELLLGDRSARQPAGKSPSLSEAARARAWSAFVSFFCGSPFAASAAGTRTAAIAPIRVARLIRRRSSYWRRLRVLVGQVGPQPALDLGDRRALATGIVLHLVAADAADGEVPRVRMCEVHAADAGPRERGVRLGQPEAGLLGAEQGEQLALLAVVGACGVAEGRPDPPVLLRDQLLVRELLPGGVPGPPHLGVEVLGEGLGQPVGERLDDDRAVVVVLGLEPRGQLVGPVDADREGADRIAAGRGGVARGASGLRGDVVGQAPVGAVVAVVELLPQEAEPGALVEQDVVAVRMRRPEPVDAARVQRALADDLVQGLDRVVVELSRLRAVEDRRKLALQVPGVEEELP